MTMAATSPSIGQAIWHWILYVIVFCIAGGLAAGVTALLYELVTQEPYARELYAVIFGVAGYIAYRRALAVVEPGRAA